MGRGQKGSPEAARNVACALAPHAERGAGEGEAQGPARRAGLLRSAALGFPRRSPRLPARQPPANVARAPRPAPARRRVSPRPHLAPSLCLAAPSPPLPSFLQMGVNVGLYVLSITRM